ncbi:helix-turn-helix domain-containing protein, partial [Anaerotruncus colihominis]|uniref:helix-turn-helix domain-containing protein n=1 Tax=Anaerotruncus colihominis TaxID=169435 RepID=UPI001FACEB43
MDLTQQEFADRIKVKRNTVATYELGRSEPSDAAISLICKEFNVNERWLRTGEGEIFLQMTRDEEIAAFIGGALAKETDSF